MEIRVIAKMDHPYDEDPKYRYNPESDDNEPENPYYDGYFDSFLIEEE